MTKDCISIDNFLRTTQLGEHDLIELLRQGELRFLPGEHGELLIDVSGIDQAALANAALPAAEQQVASELLIEEAASAVLQSLEGVLDEALEMALRWLSVENDSSEDIGENN